MLKTYRYEHFPYQQSSEQRSGRASRHEVVVVGAGPVGLTVALDLAARGHRVVVLDDGDTVSVGSRAVCYAKRPLEIWNRLGCAGPLLEKGVSWNLGKVFAGETLAYQFDLLPETGHQIPAMINLQQYYLEETLIQRANENPLIEIRWKHKVLSVRNRDDLVGIVIETDDGVFTSEAKWLIACDGANSTIRGMVGAQFNGQYFQDRFLIADIVMEADFPAERWFWFDPPFHPGQSVLLHKQADNVWRIDFQLGWDADPDEERKPERVKPRIQAMLGDDRPFELEWISIYQFACRRIDRFRHGRVLFAGDSAHQVSPFGARGANTGVQDADNLGWKLSLVLQGLAPERLIDSYDEERSVAADDNLANSTRSTDFITPKSSASRLYRDAVLTLSKRFEFARPLVNSGRLSSPTPYPQSSLNTQVCSGQPDRALPGTLASDAPVQIAGQPGWFLEQLGQGFTLLLFDVPDAPQSLSVDGIDVAVAVVGRDMNDAEGLLQARLGAARGAAILLRPDHHIAARWDHFNQDNVARAIRRATANEG